MKELRVAFPYHHPAKFYEPTRIDLSPEYVFLDNTFSPLVEVSPEDGSIQRGVANHWEWPGSEISFQFGPTLKPSMEFQSPQGKTAVFSPSTLLLQRKTRMEI